MLKNYLTIALRNLHKHTGYTLINVLGLAVGMACCLLIALYVTDELSYDRFHEHADRIYRLVQEQRFGSVQQVAVMPGPAGPALEQDFPEVEASVRLRRGQQMVRREGTTAAEQRVVFADTSFFSVFSFVMQKGTPSTALTEPNTVILTERLARTYFDDEDPMDQTLLMNDQPYRVTGVVQNTPSNAHFHFDLLASFSTLNSVAWIQSWQTNGIWTYLLLKENASPDTLNAKLDAFIERHRGEDALASFTYYVQPLTAIHLHSNMIAELEPNGDAKVVYIFAAIALFILLIACINYTNLATARSAQRALEVGVRKAMGAHRRSLIGQFLTESILLTFVAMGLALLLAELALPAFRTLSGKALPGHVLVRPSVLVSLVGLTLIVGLLAGGYPAFFLARFQPVRVLKGTLPQARGGLRKTLVVFQFAISIALLIATGVTLRQLAFIQNKHLGFDKDHLIDIQLRGPQTRAKQIQAVLETQTGVVRVTAASDPIDDFGTQSTYRPESPDADEVLMNRVEVDEAFLETMGMTQIAGRAFSVDLAARDTTETVLLNEAAVRQFGWPSPQEALGKRLYRGPTDTGLEVIGVVQDFHFASLREAIKPLVIQWRPGTFTHLLVRIRPGNVAATLARLRDAWHQLVPNAAFDYAFVDEQLDHLYRADQRTGRLFGVFAGLAIFIACLGLLGLATFTAEQRTKEIGIRKVLGASAPGLVLLLSKDFAQLVGVAFLVAAPVAYLAMNRWLDDFAYRMDLEAGPFLLAGALAFAIALATVSYQAIQAATANPVESLRYE